VGKTLPAATFEMRKSFFNPFIDKDEIERQSSFKNYVLFIYEYITLLYWLHYISNYLHYNALKKAIP